MVSALDIKVALQLRNSPVVLLALASPLGLCRDLSWPPEGEANGFRSFQ